MTSLKTPKASKMESFATQVNGFLSLTIVAKLSISDVCRVLDIPPSACPSWRIASHKTKSFYKQLLEGLLQNTVLKIIEISKVYLVFLLETKLLDLYEVFYWLVQSLL